MHKVEMRTKESGESEEELVVSNLRPFTLKVGVHDANDVPILDCSLPLRATLLYENGAPVKQVQGWGAGVHGWAGGGWAGGHGVAGRMRGLGLEGHMGAGGRDTAGDTSPPRRPLHRLALSAARHVHLLTPHTC